MIWTFCWCLMFGMQGHSYPAQRALSKQLLLNPPLKKLCYHPQKSDYQRSIPLNYLFFGGMLRCISSNHNRNNAHNAHFSPFSSPLCSEAGTCLRHSSLMPFVLSLTWGHCFLALAMVTCQLVCGESKHDSVYAVSSHSPAPPGTVTVRESLQCLSK